MIHINYPGRFGNNLFQYFVGLILSKKFDQKINNPFSNNILKCKDYSNNEISYETDLVVNDFNIYSLLETENVDQNIILDGFFQNRPVLELLKSNKHLFFDNGHTYEGEGTFVHVRLGDIVNDSASCKIDYYRKALEGLNGGYISSDSLDHDIVKNLSDEFNLQIFDSSPEETIIFGSKFDNKILSLGTFSWWIGFLGNQNNVICPVTNEYRQWHGDIFPFLNWKEVSIK